MTRNKPCASPCYHLISAANPEDDVSIGARALTGEAYLGHVFWDTEIFLCPSTPHVARGGARAADVPLPHLARRARQGRPAGLPRRALRLGVGRHRRRGDAHATCCARRQVDRDPAAAHRSSTSAPTSPTRSGSTGRRPATTQFLLRGRRRDHAGDSSLLGQPRRHWKPMAATTSARSSAPTSTTRAWTTTPTRT